MSDQDQTNTTANGIGSIPLLDDLASVLEGIPIRFGLVSQGHIPTIERCLGDGWTWLEIGEAIGWCPRTAEQHYKWYLEEKERANQSSNVQ